MSEEQKFEFVGRPRKSYVAEEEKKTIRKYIRGKKKIPEECKYYLSAQDRKEFFDLVEYLVINLQEIGSHFKSFTHKFKDLESGVPTTRIKKTTQEDLEQETEEEDSE